MKFLLLVDRTLPVAIGVFHLWGLYLVIVEVGCTLFAVFDGQFAPEATHDCSLDGWIFRANGRPITASLWLVNA